MEFLMNKDIRWQQRFENFLKAFEQLKKAVTQDKLNELERAGLIQTFEYTYELSWKTLKDFLETEGITAKTPRETIQEAFKASFIIDGHNWIDALENRNLLSHTYEESLSLKACELIKKSYFPFLKKFKDDFEKKKP